MVKAVRDRQSRRARRAPKLALMGLFAAVGISAIVTACGDDSTSGTPDASTEASTSDQAVNPVDSSIGDTSLPNVDAADASDAMVCLGATDAAGLDDAMVQTGHDLVVAFKCANCHQPTPIEDSGLYLSGGDKFLDGSVFSANLTPDPVNGLGCWTDPQIVTAILNGIDDKGMALCVMPKFGAKVDGGDPRMDAGAALAVATFLRSLEARSQAVPASMCPAIADAGADADAAR